MNVQKVLFSCVGTTDPARGGRDGGLMHIMRKYRPQVVCIFITEGILRLDKQDHRFEKMMAHMKEHWDGYAPQLIRREAPIENASDLELVDEHLSKELKDFASQYPDAEILLNLSSGTPQMQIILAQMVLDPRYKMCGIQVSTPGRDANTTARTNDKDYNVDDQLREAERIETEKNEDRCRIPPLFPLRRKMQWEQINTLLTQKNYAAIVSMADCLPAKQMKLVAHLSARNQLQHKEAQKIAAELSLDFPLYPYKQDGISKDYRDVSEYFLMMKNLQQADRYTDFILRLNPLTLRLQRTLLDQLLAAHHGFKLDDLMVLYAEENRKLLSADLLQQKLPEVYAAVNAELEHPPLEDADLSIYVCNLLLKHLPETPPALLELFLACGKLNRKHRNPAAHSLYNLTEENIQKTVGMSCAELVEQLEKAILAIYPAECDPSIFTVYDRCEEYIRQQH